MVHAFRGRIPHRSLSARENETRRLGICDERTYLLSVPFALVISVWFMWALDYHLSVAVAVGLIALAGVAAETGVVMLLYLDHAYDARIANGALHTRTDVDAAVDYGAVERVRLKMMTVTAIMAGRSMSMPANASWTALMDSVRQDLVSMPDMTAQQLKGLYAGPITAASLGSCKAIVT